MTTKNIFNKLILLVIMLLFVIGCKSPNNPTAGGGDGGSPFDPKAQGFQEASSKVVPVDDFASLTYDNPYLATKSTISGNTRYYCDYTDSSLSLYGFVGSDTPLDVGLVFVEEVTLTNGKIYTNVEICNFTLIYHKVKEPAPVLEKSYYGFIKKIDTFKSHGYDIASTSIYFSTISNGLVVDKYAKLTNR